MKTTLLTCMAALLLSFAASCADAPNSVPPLTTQPAIDMLFSPHGGCTARIVDEIGKAKRTIRVQAYSFTSAPIAKAVVDAKKRGVDCEVVLDKSQAKQTYSEVDFFHNQGVPAFIDDRHAIAHNKIILIDDATVITGSFNFTKAAEESNAENLLVIRNQPELIRKYLANYDLHRKHSQSYEPPSGTDGKPEDRGAGKNEGEAGVEFVGSRNSDVYHYPSCSVVKKIRPENLVTYKSAPEGKSLHKGCPG